VKRDIGHLCHDEAREPRRQGRKSEERIAISTPDRTGQIVSREHSSTIEEEPDLRDPMNMDSVTPTDLLNTTAMMKPQQPGLENHEYIDFPLPQRPESSTAYYAGDYANSFQFASNPGEWAVSDEFNFLNDFLNTSLLDDGALVTDELDSTLPDTLARVPLTGNAIESGFPSSESNIRASNTMEEDKPTSGAAPKVQADKAREKYYLTAADPAGTDAPEERMNKLLRAKYDAGLLKPFNYIKGYAKMNQFMDRNLLATSRQRILRQLDRFRPKFRERMQRLTDIELVMVEMWFERKLMEYDRVFASMAIPACLWRRSGEIFRGNREMAELIHVPVEHLRDGKLSIHEIFVEDSLVSYWEKFGAIAFDASQKAILTSCSLHSPQGEVTGRDNKYTDIEKDGMLKCCFSFTIIRDTHSM